MIVIIPQTFETLGPFLREELPKFVWQTACDSVIGGKMARQLVGDRFRQWKIKVDSAELIKVEVRAGLSCRFKSGFRKFLISAQPSPNGTRIEIVETKSWGWLTVAVTLALLFFIVPGIFRIIGNIMWTRRNRLVLESVAAKVCLLFPGTNVGDVASAPVSAIPRRAVIPPPPVPVGPPPPASIITGSAAPVPPPPTLQGITSRPPPPPPQVWAPPPVPLQMVTTPTISSAEDDPPIDLSEPAEELPSTMPPPPQWAPPPISPEQIKAPPLGGGEQNLADAPYASSQPSFFALHSLKIIAAVVALVSVTALALTWPWISNEIHNAVPQSAQITDYISPLIEEKLDHSPAVKIDVSISKITKLGRGKAEAQVHVSVIAQEDFLDRVDFEEIAKANGYDPQGFDKATEDARSLPQDYAPAALSVPIPTLARITTPKGTQHDYDLLVAADRDGKNWIFSLSPDQTTLSQIVNFSGTPRSSWATQPGIVDSDTSVQAITSVIEYRKSFVAAVATAKTNYAKFQEEELQRKQNAAIPPPSSVNDNLTASPNGSAGAASSTPVQSPQTEYPPKATIKGKVALCLRASSGGQSDALLVQCDNANGEPTGIHGTVMLIGYPSAATSKVGDDVNVPGDFVAVVTLNTGNGNVTNPQYRFSGATFQNPDDQLNALYQQIITSGRVNSDAMKKVQLKWIAYRDTQAGFEALIGRGTVPDESARQAALIRITTKRLVELQHIAQNGVSGDLPAPTPTPAQDPLSTTFAGFFQVLNNSQNPQIISAYVETEKAWDAFASQQADLDRRSLTTIAANDGSQLNDTAAVRLANERVDELKALASSMRIQIPDNNVSAPNQPVQATQQNAPAMTNTSPGPSLDASNVGGNAYKGRGHIYSIPDLNSLVGKDVRDAWLYGSFLLFNQDGNKAICHPKTAWSIQSNEVHIDFDQLTLPVGIWQGIANQQQALALYESGNVDAYNNFTSQNPVAAILFVAKKEHPLKILKVYRQPDGKIVALTKGPGEFRVEGGPANGAPNADAPNNSNANPSGIVIPDSPGFVRSPYAPDQPPVDVRGYASGTQVRCPYTNKIFVIP